MYGSLECKKFESWMIAQILWWRMKELLGHYISNVVCCEYIELKNVGIFFLKVLNIFW